MKTMTGTLGWLLAAVVATGLLAAACSVTVPEDAVFSCAADADCGGDGYVCLEASGTCCLPKAELCNGLDDDCDGQVDDSPTDLGACYGGPPNTQGVGRCVAGAETCVDGARECEGDVGPGAEQCNQLDDDCDGQVDEDFDLQTNTLHCGACDAKCQVGKPCVNGECPVDNEFDCGDDVDEDKDGQTDCADTDCEGDPCGTAGCKCVGGARTEADCANGTDDDGDGQMDCFDTDCLNQFCQASPSTFRCDSSNSCRCGGVTNPAPETIACTNGVDDDCDGAIDCADSGCDTQSCGTGCVCKNLKKSEADCGDYLPGSSGPARDNDGDGEANCRDVEDCPEGWACKNKSGTSGTCTANLLCQ